jgi:hypothetical protein
LVFAEHVGVGDEDGVGLEASGFTIEEGGEVGAADFFFAFEPDFDINGEFSGGAEVAFDGFEVDEELAFVVASASGVEVVAEDGGLEGGMVPGFDGVDRLDVVVAVEEEGGFVEGLEPVGVDAGRAAVDAGEDLDVVEADFGEVAGEPLGAGLDVFVVLGLGGDGGEGD